MVDALPGATGKRSGVPSCAPRTGNRQHEPQASEATFHRAQSARGTKHKARTMRDAHRMNCLPHSKLLDADHAPSQVFVLMDRNHASLGMLGSYAPTRAAARSFHSHGLAHRYRRNRWQEMCATLPARLHSETRLLPNVRSVRTPLYPERRASNIAGGRRGWITSCPMFSKAWL